MKTLISTFKKKNIDDIKDDDIIVRDRPNGNVYFCTRQSPDIPFSTITRKLINNKIVFYRDGRRIDMDDHLFKIYNRIVMEAPIRNVPRFRKISETLVYRIVDAFDSFLDKNWFPNYKGFIKCYQFLLKAGAGEYTYIPVDVFHNTTDTKFRNKIICALHKSQASYLTLIKISGLTKMQIYNICNKNRRRKICIK